MQELEIQNQHDSFSHWYRNRGSRGLSSCLCLSRQWIAKLVLLRSCWDELNYGSCLRRRKEGWVCSSRTTCIQRPRAWNCVVCSGGPVKAARTAGAKPRGGIVNSMNWFGYVAKHYSGCVCAGFCIWMRLTFTGWTGWRRQPFPLWFRLTSSAEVWVGPRGWARGKCCLTVELEVEFFLSLDLNCKCCGVFLKLELAGPGMGAIRVSFPIAVTEYLTKSSLWEEGLWWENPYSWEGNTAGMWDGWSQCVCS